MNENKEKERIESLEETNLKWQGILLLIILLFFFYLVASIIVSIAFDTSTIFNQAKFDSNLMVNIKPIIIFLIVDWIFFVLLFSEIKGQNNKWKEWAEKKLQQKEQETKQIIQKQTEQLKKELLETKTELLLTQNKLRELKEETGNK